MLGDRVNALKRLGFEPEHVCARHVQIFRDPCPLQNAIVKPNESQDIAVIALKVYSLSGSETDRFQTFVRYHNVFDFLITADL